MTVESTQRSVVYRRSPYLVADWSSGSLTVLQVGSGRRFKARPEVLALLDVLEEPASLATLSERISIPEADLAVLLVRMVEAGCVVEVKSELATARYRYTPHLSPCEWAVHRQVVDAGLAAGRKGPPPSAKHENPEVLWTLKLPTVYGRKSDSLARVLSKRRSVRKYAATPMDLPALSTFLRESCAVREFIGPADRQTTHRASPSGGAKHSIEVYAFIHDVEGADRGVYHYDPFRHALSCVAPWDESIMAIQRRLVWKPAMLASQPPVALYLTSVMKRVLWKYPTGALPLIYRDAGCLLQTMYLVATDLGLAPCAMAAIDYDLSPAFLDDLRDEMIHVGSFALGVADG